MAIQRILFIRELLAIPHLFIEMFRVIDRIIVGIRQVCRFLEVKK